MTAAVAVTAESARVLTDRIKVAVEGVWQLVQEAYTSRAWAALGYGSWDDYCQREFGTSRLRLPREERQEVVASLRESGLSVRAISDVTGVAYNTVLHDEQVTQIESPAERPPILGRDGKTYNPRPVVDRHTGEINPPIRTITQPRTNVVAVVNTALFKARDAATAADQIKREHLISRSEEAAVWSRDLSQSMESLQRLLDALKEASL